MSVSDGLVGEMLGRKQQSVTFRVDPFIDDLNSSWSQAREAERYVAVDEVGAVIPSKARNT
jgi:hypothetical protein